MGLNMSTDRSLWRDRALLELNIAVLHSFDQAGVTVTDHHTESERFLTHLRREERAGRLCHADWSWIVPPWQAPHAAYSIATTTTQTCGPVSTGTHRRLCPTRKARIHERHPQRARLSRQHVLQERCGSTSRATKFYGTQVLSYLNERMQAFVAAAETLFIATADGAGECDCSFRAGPPGFIKVLGADTIAYPEYRGNGVMASLGNMLQNPHIGILIVDFVEALIGLHINGAASVLDPVQANRTFPALTADTGAPGARPSTGWRSRCTRRTSTAASTFPVSNGVPQRRDWGTDDPHRKGGDYFGAATSLRLTDG